MTNRFALVVAHHGKVHFEGLEVVNSPPPMISDTVSISSWTIVIFMAPLHMYLHCICTALSDDCRLVLDRLVWVASARETFQIRYKFGRLIVSEFCLSWNI